MGVLDTFVFLLETDNRNALRGLSDAGHALDDVEDGSNDAHKAMLEMFTGVGEKAGITADSFKELAIGALGIAGAGLSLNAVLEHTTEMLAKVRAAETIGVDIGQYDALSRTFQALGVDADGFRDSMIDLNESLGEAAADAKSGKAESFKTFGIALRDTKGNIKSADDALLQLSDSMSKMDKQQATFQIKQLGITDNAVIAAMLKGRSELERQIKFQKDLGVTSAEDAKKLESFARAQNELSAIFSRFADVISITVVPALDLLIDTTIAVIKWARENKGVLIGFFGSLAIVAIPMLTTALWGMAAAAWAAIIPFLPLIAVMATLGLVIDDLYAYFSGGESAIGKLAEKFPLLKSVLDGAKESVLEIWEALKVLFTDPSQFMDNLVAELKQNWDTLVSDGESAANALLDAITKVWDKLSTDTKAIFSELLAWIKGLFSQFGSYISNSVSDAANAAYDALPDFVKKGINLVKGDDEKTTPPQPRKLTPTPGGSDMAVPGDEQFVAEPHKKPESVIPTPTNKSNSDDEANPLKQRIPSLLAVDNSMKAATSAPVIPANPSAISNSRPTTIQNTQRIDKVEVNTGSGDPQQIRTAVSDGMSDSVQQMTNQYDNGVSH